MPPEVLAAVLMENPLAAVLAPPPVSVTVVGAAV
jgi:hypothetical protein